MLEYDRLRLSFTHYSTYVLQPRPSTRSNDSSLAQLYPDQIFLSITDRCTPQTFLNRPERMTTLIDEFQPQWEARVTNFAQAYVTQRLDQIDNVYMPLSQLNSPQQQMARDILDKVVRLGPRFQRSCTFDRVYMRHRPGD